MSCVRRAFRVGRNIFSELMPAVERIIFIKYSIIVDRRFAMADEKKAGKGDKELGGMDDEMATISQLESNKIGGGGGKKKIIILAALVVLLGGGGFAAYHFLLAKKSVKKPANKPAETKKAPVGPMFDLKPFLTNLADQNHTSYIKVDISLEFKQGTDIAKIKQLTPQIRNNIIMIMSSKTSNEINSPEGMVSLRHQIARSLNMLLGAGTVTGVYFNNYLVQ